MKKSITIGAFILVLAFVGYTQAVPQGNPFQGLLALISGLDTRVTNLEDAGGGGGDNLMIVDSSDPPKLVGKAGPTGGFAVYSHNGQIFNLPITSAGYRRGRILFESANCDFLSGDGALEEIGRPDPFFSPTVHINAPGNTVYLEQPGSFAIRNTISQLADDGTCLLVSGPSGVMQNTVIMDPIVDLDTVFTPPFKKVGDAPSLPLP